MAFQTMERVFNSQSRQKKKVKENCHKHSPMMACHLKGIRLKTLVSKRLDRGGLWSQKEWMRNIRFKTVIIFVLLLGIVLLYPDRGI